MQLKWGEVPSWAGVLVAMAAFFLTLRLLKAQQNQLKAQQQQFANMETELLRDQARFISAWCSSPPQNAWNGPSDEEGNKTLGDIHLVTITIRNGSEEPIANVEVTLDVPESPVFPRSETFEMVSPQYVGHHTFQIKHAGPYSFFRLVHK
jgi:hypothetical protein